MSSLKCVVFNVFKILEYLSSNLEIGVFRMKVTSPLIYKKLVFNENASFTANITFEANTRKQSLTTVMSTGRCKILGDERVKLMQ